MKNLLCFRFLKFRKLSILLGIALLSFMLSLIWFTPKSIGVDSNYLESKNRNTVIESKQSQAIRFLKLVISRQSDYRIKTGRFASRFSEIRITTPSNSRSYSYNIVFSDAAKMLITARAKEYGLKSYIGGTAAHGSGNEEHPTDVVTVICGTNKPSTTVPNYPEFRVYKDFPNVDCPPRSIKVCSNEVFSKKLC